MHLHNLDEIMHTIQTRTASQLAGVQFPQRLDVLQNRDQQIRGMLALARYLKLDHRLQRFLEQHLARLKDEINGE